MTHRGLVLLALSLVCLLIPRPGRAQSEFASGRFTTSDGVELHYLEAGSGRPLVFVPGWTMPAWIWEHQIRHFASKYRVVAFDPRGHGESEKPAFGYHPTQRARDISELVDHLGGEPAVLVGWSIAVSEVLLFAEEFGTERVRALVLVDHPLTFGLDPHLFTPRFEAMQTDRENWTREFVRAIYRGPQSEQYLESIAQAALDMPTNAAAVIIANFILLGPTDLRPAFESVDRPVLFLASAQDWAVEAANEVREEYPATRVEVIEDTEHALFVDRPERFNEVLEEFLESLPD